MGAFQEIDGCAQEYMQIFRNEDPKLGTLSLRYRDPLLLEKLETGVFFWRFVYLLRRSFDPRGELRVAFFFFFWVGDGGTTQEMG